MKFLKSKKKHLIFEKNKKIKIRKNKKIIFRKINSFFIL